MPSSSSARRAYNNVFCYAAVAIGICLFFQGAIADDRRGQAKPFPQDTDQILVKYKNGSSFGIGEKLAKENLILLRKLVATPLKHEGMGSNGIQILSLEYKISLEQVELIARELSKSPLVEYAEPNYRMYPQTSMPDNPSYPAQ